MMFALPNQDLNDWSEDIKKANDLGSTHLSTYCLTFEEDTALFVKLSEGKLAIDEEKERAFYLESWDLLKSFGFQQYEISNFARSETSRCMHNVNTWKMNEWIGCGPSAASQFNGYRYRNPSSIKEWLKGFENQRITNGDEVVLSKEMLFTDSLIFGLRMNEGIDFEELSMRFLFNNDWLKNSYLQMMDQFESEGYLKKEGTRFILTREGQLKCDAIGTELFNIDKGTV